LDRLRRPAANCIITGDALIVTVMSTIAAAGELREDRHGA